MVLTVEVAAGAHALRKIIDQTGYGGWVSDDRINQATVAVIKAVDGVRAMTTPVHTEASAK